MYRALRETSIGSVGLLARSVLTKPIQHSLGAFGACCQRWVRSMVAGPRPDDSRPSSHYIMRFVGELDWSAIMNFLQLIGLLNRTSVLDHSAGCWPINGVVFSLVHYSSLLTFMNKLSAKPNAVVNHLPAFITTTFHHVFPT